MLMKLNYPEGNQQQPTTEILEPCSDDGTSADGRVWNGFKLVSDNIDKNYRQSCNRMDKKTIIFIMQCVIVLIYLPA